MGDFPASHGTDCRWVSTVSTECFYFFPASSSPRSSLRQTKSGKLGQNKELYHKGPAKHPWLEVEAAAVHQNVRNIGENWENP